MGTDWVNKGAMTASVVVAASDSLNKAAANYVCNGTNDHIEIQAALDALPTTGGEVLLLDGTYNIEVTLTLDSYQTLRGCGRNTILTTTTAGVDIITGTGGDGTELVGILIADLCVDGTVGGATVNFGIYFEYVDYSRVISSWVKNCTDWGGIALVNCDFDEIISNTIENCFDGIYLETSCNIIIVGNLVVEAGEGIYLETSNNNTIEGNACIRANDYSIYLYGSNTNIISGNTCSRNDKESIFLSGSDGNVISGNICQRNGWRGIYLSDSHSNIVSGNICRENSQNADNTYDNILISASDYNLIEGNLCRAPTIGTTLSAGEPAGETEIAVTAIAGFEVGMGVVIDLGGGSEEYHRIVAIAAAVITIDAGLTNIQALGETIDVPEARYGINISNATCNKNVVIGNDLYDSGKTANFNDVGTLTMVRDDNRNIDVIQVKHYVYVKNTSGSQRVAGDVVIIKGIATDVEFTTTVTQGDDKVYGMVAETIEDNASGYVLVKGFTAVLKVDGTIDIAIDDILGTFTTPCIAMKAAAGDQGFALALEVYAADDSNGVINAYIKSPWD